MANDVPLRATHQGGWGRAFQGRPIQAEFLHCFREDAYQLRVHAGPRRLGQSGGFRLLARTRPLFSIICCQGHRVINDHLLFRSTKRHEAAHSRRGACDITRARWMRSAAPLFFFLLGEKGDWRAERGGPPSWKKEICEQRRVRLMFSE